jgi:hypothetical protein
MKLNELTTLLENYQLPTSTRFWSGIGFDDLPCGLPRRPVATRSTTAR